MSSSSSSSGSFVVKLKKSAKAYGTNALREADTTTLSGLIAAATRLEDRHGLAVTHDWPFKPALRTGPQQIDHTIELQIISQWLEDLQKAKGYSLRLYEFQTLNETFNSDANLCRIPTWLNTMKKLLTTKALAEDDVRQGRIYMGRAYNRNRFIPWGPSPTVYFPDQWDDLDSYIASRRASMALLVDDLARIFENTKDGDNFKGILEDLILRVKVWGVQGAPSLSDNTSTDPPRRVPDYAAEELAAAASKRITAHRWYFPTYESAAEAAAKYGIYCPTPEAVAAALGRPVSLKPGTKAEGGLVHHTAAATSSAATSSGAGSSAHYAPPAQGSSAHYAPPAQGSSAHYAPPAHVISAHYAPPADRSLAQHALPAHVISPHYAPPAHGAPFYPAGMTTSLAAAPVAHPSSSSSSAFAFTSSSAPHGTPPVGGAGSRTRLRVQPPVHTTPAVHAGAGGAPPTVTPTAMGGPVRSHMRSHAAQPPARRPAQPHTTGNQQ